MMFKNIFLKTLRDKRKSIIGWSIGFFLYTIFITSLYPTFTSEKEAVINYIKLFADMPFLKLFGINSENILDFTSPEGFLNPEFFYMVAPMLIIMLGIALGSDTLAGEEERKTMDLLLSNPISRSRIVLEKFLAITSIIFIVIPFTYIGFLISLFTFNIEINPLKLLQAMIMLGFLGLSFGSLAFVIGGITGNKGKSIAISSVAAIVSYLINALSNMISAIEKYRFLSLFYYYGGDNPLKKGMYLPHLFVIIFIILVLLIISLLSFERRDIKI